MTIRQSGTGGGYLRSTGTVTVETMNNAFINILDYSGIDPTGVNDSWAAIQNALNEASANLGGTIVFPAGTYLFSKPLVVVESPVSWRSGAICIMGLSHGTWPNYNHTPGGSQVSGIEGTRLVYSGTSGNAFQIGPYGNGFTVENLMFSEFDVTKRTGGNFFYFEKINFPKFFNCRFNFCYNPIRFHRCHQTYVESVHIYQGYGDACIKWSTTSTEPTAIAYGRNIFVATAAGGEGSTTTDGFVIGPYCNSGELFAVDCNRTRRGFVFGEGDSARLSAPSFWTLTSCDAENCSQAGLDVYNATHLYVHNMYSCVNASHGVRLRSSIAGNTFVFTGCRFSGNGHHGILNEGADNVAIIGCSLGLNSIPTTDVGSGPTNTYDGINVSGPVNSLKVLGCRIGGGIYEETDVNDAHQRYGIRIEASATLSNLVIVGNDLSRNKSGAFSDASPDTLNTKVINCNIGLDFDENQTFLSQYSAGDNEVLIRPRASVDHTSIILWPKDGGVASLREGGFTHDKIVAKSLKEETINANWPTSTQYHTEYSLIIDANLNIDVDYLPDDITNILFIQGAVGGTPTFVSGGGGTTINWHGSAIPAWSVGGVGNWDLIKIYFNSDRSGIYLWREANI